MIDHEALTAPVEGHDPITDNQARLAALQCCAHAADAEEAALFMLMLGIHPDQDDEETDSPRLDIRQVFYRAQ